MFLNLASELEKLLHKTSQISNNQNVNMNIRNKLRNMFLNGRYITVGMSNLYIASEKGIMSQTGIYSYSERSFRNLQNNMHCNSSMLVNVYAKISFYISLICDLNICQIQQHQPLLIKLLTCVSYSCTQDRVFSMII